MAFVLWSAEPIPRPTLYTAHVPQEGLTPSHLMRLDLSARISMPSPRTRRDTHRRRQFSHALLTLLLRFFPAVGASEGALGPACALGWSDIEDVMMVRW